MHFISFIFVKISPWSTSIKRKTRPHFRSFIFVKILTWSTSILRKIKHVASLNRFKSLLLFLIYLSFYCHCKVSLSVSIRNVFASSLAYSLFSFLTYWSCVDNLKFEKLWWLMLIYLSDNNVYERMCNVSCKKNLYVYL